MKPIEIKTVEDLKRVLSAKTSNQRYKFKVNYNFIVNYGQYNNSGNYKYYVNIYDGPKGLNSKMYDTKEEVLDCLGAFMKKVNNEEKVGFFGRFFGTSEEEDFDKLDSLKEIKTTISIRSQSHMRGYGQIQQMKEIARNLNREFTESVKKLGLSIHIEPIDAKTFQDHVQMTFKLTPGLTKLQIKKIPYCHYFKILD